MGTHLIAAAAAAVALAPFAVSAGPLVDVLSVQYEGVVSGVRPLSGDAPCLCGYEAGQKVSGTLLVDFRTLAADLAPERADFADYFVEPPFLGPSFVVGSPVRAVSRDRVQISDHVDGVDTFLITDSESGVSVDASGGERFDLDSVLLTASSGKLDFLRGESISQTFALAGAHIGEGEIQIRRERVDEPKSAVGGTIDFILKKLTVKPARCEL
jgi:hypothetical protein